MKQLLFIFISILTFGTSYAFGSQSIKLMDVVSEPEGGLTRTIYLNLDENTRISSFEIKVEGKTQLIADREEFKKGDVLVAEVIGFDSVFIKCMKCLVDNGKLEMRYLSNGPLGRYASKTIQIKRQGATWVAIETESKRKIDTLKFTSRKFLGILYGVKDVLINPSA